MRGKPAPRGAQIKDTWPLSVGPTSSDLSIKVATARGIQTNRMTRIKDHGLEVVEAMESQHEDWEARAMATEIAAPYYGDAE